MELKILTVVLDQEALAILKSCPCNLALIAMQPHTGLPVTMVLEKMDL